MKHMCWKLVACLLPAFVPFLFTGATPAQRETLQRELTVPKEPETVYDERIGQTIVKGQLLVTLHEGVKVEDLKPIMDRMDARYEVVARIESMNQYTLATDHERLPEIKQRLENHPYVASSAFNGVWQVKRVFNDPVFKKPKDSPEDKDNWNLYRINAPEAWDITTGGALVAIIDTGAVLEHEELAGRITGPYSYATNSTTMQQGMKKIKHGPKVYATEEVRNHGTHVAVIIGGQADNGVGTAGVAPSSPLMPLQACIYRDVFPEEGAGQLYARDEHVNQALALALDRRAAAINMSLGGVSAELLKSWRAAKTDQEKQDLATKFLARADDRVKSLAPFFDRALRMGTIVVVAAGNDDIPAEFVPYALSKRVISVAATTRQDQRAKFSDYGPFTTVSAPGVDVWSGFAEPDKPYAYLSGTSMACPHATGVVALMKTIDPSLKLADVAAILIKTGRTLNTDQPIGPLINARAALDETKRRLDLKVREPDPPPLIPPPGVNPTLPALPGAGIDILRRPNPWNNPDIIRIIRVWLAFAIPRPPAGADPTIRWFFNINGQIVNNRTLLDVPRPLWFQFNFRWLWENALTLDSINLGPLYEFVIGTLRIGRFDPAPTRVPENVRPRPTDPRPGAGALPVDPRFGKTRWAGANGTGDKIDFDFGDNVVTITRGGKTIRCILRLNPYLLPMILDFYPVDGGEPIRCLLRLTDLGQIFLRTDFTKTRPTSCSHDDPFTFHLKQTAVATVSRGFQDGDGALVDPRFAGAQVSDGTGAHAGPVGTFAGSPGSAGPRTAIAASKVNTGGLPTIGYHWVIRKFTDASGPLQFIAKSARDPRFQGKTIDSGYAGFIVISREIAADHIKDTQEAYGKIGKPFEQGSHVHMFIYRETFLVTYSLWEGKRGHNFEGESARIAANSKRLIDARFPPE